MSSTFRTTPPPPGGWAPGTPVRLDIALARWPDSITLLTDSMRWLRKAASGQPVERSTALVWVHRPTGSLMVTATAVVAPTVEERR